MLKHHLVGFLFKIYIDDCCFTNHTLRPTDIIIYDPKFYNDITLYYVILNDEEVIVKEGFELKEIITRINLNNTFDEIIYSVLKKIKNPDKKNKRTIIIFNDEDAVDKNRSTFLISLFKGIPYLDTPIIREVFEIQNGQIKMCDVPIALCLIKLLEVSYLLEQSDESGILRDIEKKVMGKKGFYDFMHFEHSMSNFDLWIRTLFIDKNNYVLFGKDGKEFYKILETVKNDDQEIRLDYVKITSLLFNVKQLVEVSSYITLSSMKNVQVSDNKVLIQYVKNGNCDVKKKVTNKFEQVYADVGIIDESTQVGHFMQWSSNIEHETRKKEYTGHLSMLFIDNSNKRLDLLKERVLTINFPVSGKEERSDYEKRAAIYKDIIRRFNSQIFYNLESAFTIRMYYELGFPHRHRSDFVNFFNLNLPEQKFIYTSLINSSIIPTYPRKVINFLDPNESKPCGYPENAKKADFESKEYPSCSDKRKEELEMMGYDIDWIMLNFIKKFRYFRYEPFYALAIFELFNICDEDQKMVMNIFQHQSRFVLLSKYSKLQNIENKQIPYTDPDCKSQRDSYINFFYDLQDVYGGSNHEIIIERFSHLVISYWINYGPPNKLMVTGFGNSEKGMVYTEMTGQGESKIFHLSLLEKPNYKDVKYK